MLALLATSVIISEAVFSFLPITSSFSARQMHAMLGYVALLIVSVHLGLHWTMIMGVVRKLCGIISQSRLRTYALRAIVIVVGALGIQGLAAVNLGSKLTTEMALLLWDFESEALGFFVHHAAIVGLGAVIGHYALQMLQMRQNPDALAASGAKRTQ